MGHLSEYNNTSNTCRNIDKEIIQQINDTVKTECINLIISGYNNYLIDSEKVFTIDEPSITAGLYNHIEKQINLTDVQCNIVPEFPEFTNSIRKGKVKPKKAKKYDLCFIHFQSKPSIFIGVEAKLLVEGDYKNKNANFLVKEYVEDKGMGKYINNIYEKEGLMLGYILKGETSRIVDKINSKITQIYSLNDILNHSVKFGINNQFVYISKHNKSDKELIHIFLDFEKFINLN